MNKKNLIKIHLTVSGQVQKVGFRNFIIIAAKKLSLSGWVRNCSTNQVEIVAVGKSRKIDKFIKRVELGTFLSEIEEVSVISKTTVYENPFDQKFQKRETV